MLNIRETFAQMGKISNNLEKHGEDDVTAFDIPVSGITLTGEEVNALIEDPYGDRWLFNTVKDLREPNVAKFKPLEMLDSFEDATIVLTVPRGASYTFAGAKIKSITLDPQRGGETLVSFSVRVRPENDDQIVDLIDSQNREVKIDIADAKVMMKGGRKQQELPLARAGEGEEPESTPDEPLTHPSQLFDGDKGPKKRGRPAKNAH